MFWTRLASGIVLAVLALITMGLGGIPLLAVLLLISLVAYRELSKALQIHTEQDNAGFNALEIAGYFGIVCYYASVYFADTDTVKFMVMICGVMAILCVYVVTFPRFHAGQVTAACFSLVYAPVMLSFIYMTREYSNGDGGYMVWLILISSWGCDTCAYVVGKLIGKHKIFPKLSPKKSLEGCIGGVLGAALIGGLYGYFFVEQVVLQQKVAGLIAFICAAGAVMSMVGDLAASAIKRNHNIKDYGKIIPGHGGVMDRFDSMIVTAPMLYLLTFVLIK